ncbi:MAG: nitrogen fixation protein NifU [Coxiella sp. DG_40]|nr:MAG: nitrogen fixation protein NifU [Coxiella sp. DG_40]
MRKKIETALNSIRPYLTADGGNVELIDVTGDTVKVRLTGACGTCPMSTMTLKHLVERTLKEQVPEVRTVVTV